MNRSSVLAAVLALGLALPAVPLASLEADAQRPDPGPRVGERAFALTMEGNAFNGETWPQTPLLEAYAGERLTVSVAVPAGAEMHTFHLHGHPWEDPRSPGEVIDTVLLRPGDVHAFRVTAGLEEGHAGDWLYHCHVGDHFRQGMWGLLRVYPYAVNVDGPLEALEIRLDQQGTGLEGAQLSAHLRSDQGPVSAAEAGEGRPVDVAVTELGDGVYRLSPDVSASASGQLVIEAEHAAGTSLARLDLTATGYELVRDVTPASDEAAAGLVGPQSV